MFDQTFSYVLAIAALVIGVMLLTGHGSVFMKGGNTQARAQKYDEKKMEKFSGICLILIGIAPGSMLLPKAWQQRLHMWLSYL